MDKLLKNYSTIEVEYNTWNRGDWLINEGCKQYLASLWIEIGHSNALLFVGAGWFAKSYKHNIERVKKHFLHYDKIFIASSTFDTQDTQVKEFIRTLPTNVVIVCRERESYKQCLKLTQQVYLSKDFAFYFDYEPYKKQWAWTLYAFREDREKTYRTHTENNDLSVGTENEWESFLRDIAEYHTIHTNRLHIAIAGTLLWKDVFLYPNSYHKNKSVYQHSLSTYPNCKFVDTKYICVGNAKTGTTSVQSAMNLLGFKTDGYHYEIVKEYLYWDKEKIINRVWHFDFVKDHPYFELYKEIWEKYDCRFILTVRDEQEWVASYRNAIAKQIYNLNETLRKKTYWFEALEQTDEFLIENIYRKNNADVLEYCEPLILDITKGDGWEKLCPFLWVDIPDIPFPHSNIWEY